MRASQTALTAPLQMADLGLGLLQRCRPLVHCTLPTVHQLDDRLLTAKRDSATLLRRNTIVTTPQIPNGHNSALPRSLH